MRDSTEMDVMDTSSKVDSIALGNAILKAYDLGMVSRDYVFDNISYPTEDYDLTQWIAWIII